MNKHLIEHNITDAITAILQILAGFVWQIDDVASYSSYCVGMQSAYLHAISSIFPAILAWRHVLRSYSWYPEASSASDPTYRRVPLITTKCAGRFTPIANVDVVQSTFDSKEYSLNWAVLYSRFYWFSRWQSSQKLPSRSGASMANISVGLVPVAMCTYES